MENHLQQYSGRAKFVQICGEERMKSKTSTKGGKTKAKLYHGVKHWLQQEHRRWAWTPATPWSPSTASPKPSPRTTSWPLHQLLQRWCSTRCQQRPAVSLSQPSQTAEGNSEKRNREHIHPINSFAYRQACVQTPVKQRATALNDEWTSWTTEYMMTESLNSIQKLQRQTHFHKWAHDAPRHQESIPYPFTIEAEQKF